MARQYDKPALSSAQIVALLQGKGLTVGDIAKAADRLQYLGYYRVKTYSRPFEDAQKKFRPGTRFEDIVELYEFDRKLRLVFLDALERFEVALRSNLIDVMCAVGGSHFYLDAQYFDAPPKTTKGKKPAKGGHEIARELAGKAANDTNHPALKHYKATYDSPIEPPIWFLLDISTLGELSKIYAGLTRTYRKQIATKFALAEEVLVSWARSMTVLRNICAHHQRLWNTDLIVNQPKNAAQYDEHLKDVRRAYSRAAISLILLNAAGEVEAKRWARSLRDLLRNAEPNVLSTMAFPADWQNLPLWRTALS